MGTILAIISTHAPAGGATRVLFALYAFYYNFYSRPCGRGDSFGCTVHLCAAIFLLTPLREGRPLPSPALRSVRTISTHAPAGGATRAGCSVLPFRDISTHAPAGGATSPGPG